MELNGSDSPCDPVTLAVVSVYGNIVLYKPILIGCNVKSISDT